MNTAENIPVPTPSALAAVKSWPRSKVPDHADRGILVDAWKEAKTMKDKAFVEDLLWQTASPIGDSGGRPLIRDWVTKYVDAPQAAVEARRRLFTAGPGIDLLWARVDSDEFSPDMAADRLTDARKLAKKEHIELNVAIERVLAEYDTWPKRAVAGRMVGVRPATQLLSPTAPRKTNGRARSKNPEIAFWAKIRLLIAAYLAERAGDLDPYILSELSKDFERELQVMTASWTAKITRAKQRHEAQQNTTLLVTRTKVTQACRTLGMDPPKPGKPADMQTAHSRKRALAKAYHPDVSPNTRDQYEAVLEAYDTLEAYNEMSKK